MTLVAGIDSSTQSCKVVVLDADSGHQVRAGSAAHPPGTEVDPQHWWEALLTAVERAGGLDDVEALSVAGQQHGLIALDEHGEVIRPALLWNDLRSAGSADDLVLELGQGDRDTGSRAWARAVGSVPLASFTVAKLRWLADHEPDHARRLAAVALPHDWLTWRLRGSRDLGSLTTDRSDASGTGYFDPTKNEWRRDLLALALRRSESQVDGIHLPTVLSDEEPAGRGDPSRGWGQLLLGAGCGDNAAAAVGMGLEVGQTSISIGTSGVVAAVSPTPTADASGLVAGFADATGRYLPLACTLNAARVLEAAATVLGVGHDQLSDLALSAGSGAGGLVHVPYLEGERTPNLPHATGSLVGMTLASMTPENVARAAVEGLLCLLADATEAVRRQGATIDRVSLIGGGARSRAVRELAPQVLGVPVEIPEPAEYVARGAARQAAWDLAGSAAPPRWEVRKRTHTAEPTPEVFRRYREVVHHLHQRPEPPC